MVVSVSKRLLEVPASPIRKLVPYAIAAKKRGIKVYHLNIGDPDIPTPDVMLRVLSSWTENPIGYDQSQGNPAFLESLVWYYKHLGYPFVTADHVQVTTGGSEAISMALFATCSQGDEVIVFEPFYANYNAYAIVNGVQLVPIRTLINNGFHLPSREIIERKITKKTRALLICNPNNPTGTVYNPEELEMLVAIAKKNNIFMLSDEVYREYTYDERKHASVLSFMQEIPDLAILLDSMSKRYSLCGVRLGCLVSLNPDVIAGILRIAQGRLSAGLIDQAIAAKLTEVPSSYLANVHDEFEKRRNLLYEGLKTIPGVTIPKPEGAFYTIVGLPLDDAEDFCTWLLTDFQDKKETVMLAPAAGFYATPGFGKNEVRIAYVINRKSLKRCTELLVSALTLYHKQL